MSDYPWKILRNDRTIITGRTGTGKSFLARNLLNQFPDSWMVIIDPANGFPMEKASQGWKIYETPDALIRSYEPQTIYRPKPEWLNEQSWSAVFDWIYERGNTLTYIDEVLHVSDPVTLRLNRSLYYILMTGRKRGDGVIACTQRPYRIPMTFLSESDHRFCFSLNLRDDRKRMAEIMGDEAIRDPNVEGKGKYFFWYQGRDVSPPILCKIVKGG